MSGDGDSSSRPRSLVITFDYAPTVGGISLVLDRFWRHLAHEGCSILAPADEGAKAFDRTHPVRTYRFPAPAGGVLGKALTFVCAALWTAAVVVRRRPQVVVSGQAVRAGPLAWLFHRLTGRPYHLWVYGGETRPDFTPLAALNRFLRRVVGDAEIIYSIGPFTTREMIDFGLPAERIVELKMGVDREVYRPRSPDADLIERYGLRDRLVFLTVGRLVERKGVDRMLEALAALGDDLPPWRYLVVSDGPYRPQLEALSARLDLTDRVTFTGFVDAGQLPRLYSVSDVFAMPNREVSVSGEGSLSVEGFGIVFIEAAACGKPVIAGRSGGAVHAVDDGRTGLLVDGDDLESVQAALLQLSDPEQRQRMGAAGIDFAAAFDWEASAAILRRYL